MTKFVTVGPPGSGKTQWCLKTVEGLIDAGVHPQQICLVTFTTVAAREIKDRLKATFPQYGYEDFQWVGTIHSLCRRLLGHPVDLLFAGKQMLDFASAYHYSYNIVDPADEDLEIHEQMLVSDADWFDQFDNWTRNSLCPDFERGYSQFFSYFDLSYVPQRFTQGTLKLYLERKRRYMADKGLLDFAGLIEKVIEGGQRPPVKYLIQDESQDSSKLLWRVLYSWAKRCEQMICVGDPDQAIYAGFLPADPEEFLRFAEGASRLDLQNSHRLPRAVQRLSEAWISKNKQRLSRIFLPRNAEGKVETFCRLEHLPIDEWSMSQDGQWSAFILSRTRRQATEHKQWLMDRGIPFATNRGEENPLQTPKGRFAHALLKLTGDESIDMQDLEGVMKWIPSKPWMTHGAKKKLEERIKSEPAAQVSWRDLPALGFSREFVEPMMEDPGKNFLVPLKFSDVEKAYLRRVYNRFGKAAFVTTPKILASNIHGSKGMEATNVVLNPDLTSYPARMMMTTPEEERRICYVGITRAKEALHILWPERDTHYRLW